MSEYLRSLRSIPKIVNWSVVDVQITGKGCLRGKCRQQRPGSAVAYSQSDSDRRCRFQ